MRVSLEFAHSSLAAIDEPEIARSAASAKIVAEWLKSEGHEVSPVILLDDKKVPPTESQAEGRKFIDLVGELGYPAETWYFETHLRRWLPQLKRLLPSRQARRLERDTTSYLRQYGCLPCSVDIALWHSLRLGYLDGGDLEPCDIAISVLGDGNAEFEDLARRNFLDHIDEGNVSSRTVTLYYPESPTAEVHIHEMLDQLALSIKEAMTCPEF